MNTKAEDMKRLRKDGGIVGYRWIHGGEIWHVYGTILDNNSTWCGESQYPSHDSFDMGIKVGEEWWFEGDIIHVMNGDKGEFTGKLYYGDGMWEVQGSDRELYLYEIIYGYADAELMKEKP
jgi:hypothetical protein